MMIYQKETLPLDAQEFVTFLEEVVNDNSRFMEILLAEITGLQCSGNFHNHYVNSYLNASECFREDNVLDYWEESDEQCRNDTVAFLEKYHGVGYSGAYRLTIVFSGQNYVIKFPIDSRDCCLTESENYERACKEGLEKYFAATYNLGQMECFLDKGYSGNIYIQKKVEIIADDVLLEGADGDFWTEGTREDGINLVSKEFYGWECLDDYDVFLNEYSCAEVLPFYGILFQLWFYCPEQELVRLLNFLDVESINDLHPGNVGFLTDNTDTYPIFIDFAGC